ncbi:MAG: hypothetical protein V1858_03370 [Candidatus Gottesmanbacteria bacterium]
MPKKTKKEKIITELRRKLELNQPSQENSTIILSETGKTYTEDKLTTNYHLPSINRTYTPPQPINHQSTSYIIKDLRKTFLLAGLAIGFELVVYWLLR